MDAIVGVWLTSVVGAAAFCAAGYVLGSSGKPVAAQPAPLPPPPISAKKLPPAPAKSASVPPPPDSETTEPPPVTKKAPIVVEVREKTLEKPNTPTAFAPPELLLKTDEPDDDDEDRPTLVPDKATQAAVLQGSVATMPPPPRAPSIRIEGLIPPSSMAPNSQDQTRQMIQNALDQVEQAVERQKAVEILKAELERQLEGVRNELRNEVILRAAAEARVEELGDRLAKASEEAGTLRHRVNMLDRQTKLLRESLKGRPVTAIRNRDDEAEEMRLKLRDVVDKLERASLPPLGNNHATPPGGMVAPASIRPPKENDDLQKEIARLASENRHLRAQTLGGSLPPKKPASRSDSVPDIDIELYRSVVDKLGTIAGLKAAVVADEVGSLLVGNGDLAEGLAAFGAYIRDASARTDRLLPLEGVDEVDIRDRNGSLLSTRVIFQKAQLSLIVLCSGDASMAAAKKLAAETLRLL
jgi:hypothetical protein